MSDSRGWHLATQPPGIHGPRFSWKMPSTWLHLQYSFVQQFSIACAYLPSVGIKPKLLQYQSLVKLLDTASYTLRH